MKFSDIFVPRYMNSDPDIRLKAVSRLADPKVLKQMSEKDEDERVRKAAAQRLVTFH